MVKFDGRLGYVLYLLPTYRQQLFELVAGGCSGGLNVFAGVPRAAEGMADPPHLIRAKHVEAANHYFLCGSLELYWQAGLLGWLRNWQPDALIMDANPRLLTSHLAVRWMHRRGRPVLAWGFGEMPLTSGLLRLRAWGRRRYLRLFDGAIAYGTRAARDYVRIGIKEDCVCIAYNATAPRPTSIPKKRPDQFDGRPQVLCVGRLIDGKGIGRLLLAAAGLPRALQPEIDIVGDGPARPRYERVAQSVDVPVRFIGAKRGPELRSYFERADVFVLPGLGGLAVQEAMAHGLPVIVAEADGTQDDLVRPSTGWHVKPNNVEDLRRVLAEALSDVSRLRQMGDAAYRVVKDEINLESMATAMLNAARITTERRSHEARAAR